MCYVGFNRQTKETKMTLKEINQRLKDAKIKLQYFNHLASMGVKMPNESATLRRIKDLKTSLEKSKRELA